MKKNLHKNFKNQEVNWELEQSIDSKLDFLYCEDEVPILSAITVFCHTNLSKHCLEALQQTHFSIKDNFLFPTVCCIGSMDLFSVFPKEQMKEILNETWGNFKPVHIASMFLNHEILRELIQVKMR